MPKQTDPLHSSFPVPTEEDLASQPGAKDFPFMNTDSNPAHALLDMPVNILIVDDEPKNLTVLESFLDDPSYRLVRAESANQALLALVVEEFALLILDIRMPGMTGFELAQMIKERKKTSLVPIIFLTAYYNDDLHVLEGYDTGAVDYLHKPVNPVILRSKVAVFAEMHRKSRLFDRSNRALLAEVTQRCQVEEQLRELNDTLERRVTERTEAMHEIDERMRLATEATGVGIWQWNVITNQVRWDAQMFRIYGITPMPDGIVQYSDWSGSVLPEDLAEQEQVLQDTVTRCGGSRREYRIQRRDNRECRDIESVETIRVNLQGEAEWVVGTNLDVTERKQLEKAQQDADRRKDEFLALLAHELRTPLAPIRNSLELMKLASGNADQIERTRAIIERQVIQMVRLVDDLLDVSRIARDQLELKKERVELALIVQQAVEVCHPHCELAGHEITLALPPEPIFLDADPTRLLQVFGNLLTNACKFTKPGGCICLTAERQGHEVAITVKDTGIGIAPEMLSKVFDLFTQIDSSLERTAGGLGIGLSLAKRLSEMHGGTVTAHSEGQDRGSEFVVRLPIMVEMPKPAPPTLGAPTPTTTRRILVVDDSQDAATTLAMLLDLGNNQTLMAHDGLEAVKQAEAFRPAVILLDIGLPKMNGYDACRAIREQPWGQDIVMIALTGWGKEEDRRKSKEAGFDGHMVKPVDYAALMKLLATLQTAKV